MRSYELLKTDIDGITRECSAHLQTSKNKLKSIADTQFDTAYKKYH